MTRRARAPRTSPGAVDAWSEPVVIPTYPTMPADRNPMFLDQRVYQGSAGASTRCRSSTGSPTTGADRTWHAVHLENEYLRLMILPELGGRIHVGYDKTTGYDFFYRNNVIKPALVGLAGPWISGGVEFNWPQHHRPATFLPVDCDDRAARPTARVTVWCSRPRPVRPA